MDLNKLFNQSRFNEYAAFLKSTNLSDASIQRKLSSLASFQKFLIKKKYVSFVETHDRASLLSISEHADSLIPKTSLFSNLKSKIKLPPVIDDLRSNFLFRYIVIFSLFAISAGLGFTLYRQAVLQSQQNLAYSTASAMITGGRFLSFQGRLTDTAGNPIISSTSIVFKLYPSVGSGTTLYTSQTGNSQTVVPDENGIFSVTIGRSHGTTIPSSVFTENAEVWLEITAGGETMNPRQQIATVGYALNSETLQGLPPSASGTKNTVLVIDGLGNLNLGETSPTIKSTSGTLGIEGQAVLIKASDGSGGNITINPDSNGVINLITEGTGATGFINATNANLASGNLFNATINNLNRGYNFINFSNYSVGTSIVSRFSVDAYGNTIIGNNLTIGGTFVSVGSTNLVTKLNSDLLDGHHSSYFLSVGDTGSLPYVNDATNTTLTRSGTSGPYTLGLNLNNTNTWTAIQNLSAGATISNLSVGGTFISVGSTNLVTNLNADLLDGNNSTYFVNIGQTGNFITTITGVGISVSPTSGTSRTLTNMGIMNATNGTLTRSGSIGSYTLGLNLNNSNTWTAIQNLSAGATISNLSVGGTFISVGSTNLVTNLNADYLNGLPSSSFVGIGSTGNFITNLTNGVGITITGSGSSRNIAFDYGASLLATGNKIGLNFGSINTWTAKQTFGNAAIGGTLALTQGAQDGYILTSDASGNSYWAPNTGVGTIYFAGSGLTLTGTTFKLGGALTENANLTIGNTSAFFINSTTGNVGIGTTNPNRALEIMKQVDGEVQLRLGNGPTTFWDLGRDGSDGYFNIKDQNGAKRLVINDISGNVGIGTTNPTSKLTVAGNVNISTSLNVGTSLVVGTSIELSSSGNRSLSYYDSSTNGYFTQMQTTATGGYGTYGPVSGDWALYNRFSGANTRGWIWQLGTVNVAGLNGKGDFQNAGNLTVGGTLSIGSVPTASDNNTVLTSVGGVVSSINTSAWDKNASDDLTTSTNLFVIKADSGTAETLNVGNTINFVGGLGLGSTVSATDTITFNIGSSAGISVNTDTIGINIGLTGLGFSGTKLINTGLVGVSNSTLTRIGSNGNYTVGLNLANINTWTALQTFGNATVGGTLTMTGTNVGTGTTALFIASNGTVTKRALGTMAFDSGTYDNYNHWKLQTNSNGTTNVLTGNTVNFINGIGISLVQSGSTITVNNIGTGTTYAAGVGLSLSSSNIFSIDYDSTLDLNGNKISLNTGNANTWTGLQTFNATGAPFAVGSSVLVTNLNAQYLNGISSNGFVGIGQTGNFITTITGVGISVSPTSGTSRTLTNMGIMNATNGTLTRSGSIGSYTLGLNLGSNNSWSNGIGVSGTTNLTNALNVGGTVYFGSYVGIGTASPNKQLQIGSAANNSSIYNDYIGSINNMVLESRDSNDSGAFVFRSNSDVGTSDLVQITRLGYVGIGTTAPGYKLDVSGTGRFTSNLTVGGTLALTQGAANGYILTSDTSGNAKWLPNTGIGTTYAAGVGLSLSSSNIFSIDYDSTLDLNGNKISLNTGNANTWTGLQTFNATGAPFAVGSNTLVTNLNAQYLNGISSNGFVGIGQTGNFITTLTAGTDISITGSGVGRTINDTSTLSTVTGRGSSTSTMLSLLGGAYFGTAGATQGVWKANGTVGIGTTNPIYGKVEITTTASNTGGLSLYRGTGSTARSWITSNDVWLMQRSTNDNAGIAIDASGYVGIGTTAPGYRLDVSGTGRFTSNLTVGGTVSLTGTNVGTGTTALFIASNGTVTKRALGTMAFDSGTYDNYNHWKLQTNSNGTTNVLTGNTVNFINGIGISLVQSGSTITVNNVGAGTTYAAGVGLSLSSSSVFSINFGSANTWTGLQTFNATGAPFAVGSSVLVTNLNAQYLNGISSNGFVGIGQTGNFITTITGVGISVSPTSGTSRTLTNMGIMNATNGTLTRSGSIGSYTLGLNLGSNNSWSNGIGVSGTTNLTNALNVGGTAYFGSYVGIGTASPSSKLDVAGAISLIQNYPLIMKSASGTYGGAIRYDTLGGEFMTMATKNSASKLLFATGFDLTASQGSSNILPTTVGLAIYNNNVGIGTTNPTSKLTVAGNGNFTGNLSVGGTVTLSSSVASNTSDTTALMINGSNVVTKRTLGDLAFQNNASLGWIAKTASGNLTIGTGTTLNFTGINGLTTANVGSSQITFSLGGFLSQNTDIGFSGFSLSFSDGGNTLVSFSSTGNTFYNPTTFTSSGDVSIAYDLNFTNSNNSNINTAGPFSINAGEVFNSSNLTLQTYNSGKIILNSSNLYTDGTYFGIGTTNPTSTLSVNGNADINNLVIDGTSGTGLNISNNSLTTDISLQNGETIDNDTNGRINFSISDLYLNSSIFLTSTRLFQAGNGTVTTPAYSFSSDTNTGIYRIGEDNIGVGTSGILRLTVAGNGNVGITKNLNVGGTLTTTTLKATNAQDTTKVTNLNADLLDGNDSSVFTTHNEVTDLGTVTFSSGSAVTTATFITELENKGAFDNYHSIMKASWDYSGNSDITDTGFGTFELAGCVVETWTDDSSDVTRGNITVRITRPTTGSGGGQILVYNDQGSTYSPGWRQIWNSSTDGSGSGLDADLLDGLHSTAFEVPLTFTNGLTRSSNDVHFGGALTENTRLNIGNTEVMFFKYANGNVGIGTTNPLAKLNVYGQSLFGTTRTGVGAASSVINLGSDEYINFAWSTSYPTGNYHRIGKDRTFDNYALSYISTGADATTNLAHVFRTTNTDSALAITAGGNIGIGTTAPGYKLDVSGTGRFTSNLTVGGTLALTQGAANGYILQSDANGNAKWIVPYGVGGTNSLSAGTDISITSVGIGRTINNTSTLSTVTGRGSSTSTMLSLLGGAYFGTAGATQGVWKANGTVGIGTTNPSGGKLQIFGEGAANGLSIYNGTGDTLRLYRVNNVGILSRGGVDTAGIAINVSGNVGIGTTNPGVKLTVTRGGAIYDAAPTLGSGTVGVFSLLSGNGLYGLYSGISSNGDTWLQSQRNDATTAAYNILLNPSGGNIGIGTTNPLYKLHVSGDALISTRLGIGVTNASYALNVSGNGNITGKLNIGTTTTTTSLNLTNTAVGGSSIAAFLSGNSGLIGYISTVGWDKNTADDYTSWTLQADGANGSSITSGSTVNFAHGTNISLVKSGNTITINNTASPYTASNGLSLVGQDIRLGGTLTQNTDIGFSGFSLSFSDGGNTLVSFSSTGNTFYNPTTFTSSGDISIAYDLNFTNSTASYIRSQAPLYIQTESPYANLDLNLTAANAGQIYLNSNVQAMANLTVGGTFTSVGSTNLVTNLNAQYLNGISSNGFVGIGQTGNFITTLTNGTDINITGSGTSRTINNTSTLSTVTGRGSSTSTMLSLLGGAYFGTAGATQGVWKANGTVGIGTTAPGYKLDIINNSATQLRVASGVGQLQGGIRFGNYDATQTADILFTASGQNSLDIRTNYSSTSNKITLSPGTVTAMTLLGSGYVGIGINPLYKLHVSGDALISTRLGIGATNANFALNVVGNGNFTDSLSVGKTLTTTTLKATNAQDTTVITNLNADYLDAQNGSYYDQRVYTSTNNYLGGYYVSGGSEKPNNTIFGAGKLKLAMLSGTNLGFGGSWNDVLWLSSYTGGDVKGSYAIIADKYSDNLYFSRQDYDSGTWGTGNKLWHSNNDGIGSSLNADLLDGLHASAFLTTLTGGTDISITGSGVGRTINDTSTLSTVTGRGSSTSTMLSLLGGAYFGTAGATQGVWKANGTVGIGTTNPLQKLQVAGDINIESGSGIRINNTATSGYYLRGNGTRFVSSGIQAADVPTLNQDTTGSAGTLSREDNRTISPSELTAGKLKFGFTSYTNNDTGPYADFLHFRSYTDATGGNDNLLVLNKTDFGMRLYQQTWGSASAYSTYKDIALVDNGAALNYLPKFSGVGTNVRVTNSSIFDNGNVGIGTTNPSYKLDIQNTSTSMAVNIGSVAQTLYSDLVLHTNGGSGEIFKAGSAYTSWGGPSSLNIYNSSGPIAFHSNGTVNSMFLSTAGNLGIGTTAPTSKLHVIGNGNITGNLTIGGTATIPRIFINRTSNTASGLSWYSPSYTAWSEYMGPAGTASQGPTGNITAPTGTLVTTWGLRSFIENASGYGWTWESGTSGTTAPSIVAELSSNTGNFKTIGAGNFGGNLTVAGETYLNGTVLEGDSKTMFRYSDSYLRLNEDNDFGNGIWTGNSNYMTGSGYISLGSNGGTTTGSMYLYGGAYTGTNLIKLDSSSTSAISYFNAGNVGIGITNPLYKLSVGTSIGGDINGNLMALRFLDIGNTRYGFIPNNTASNKNSLSLTYTGSIRFNYNDISNSHIIAGPASRIQSFSNGLLLGVSSTTTGNVAGWDNDLFLKTNGNVGIGTTAPGSKLDVDGNITQSVTHGNNMKLWLSAARNGS
ncbi:MAG: hypothetical protein PHP97_00495, partial [Candidatus Shapirobacteria bacterium]|nr:hypothetical protein [Candidatus Shapirobacteria bacterium]